MLRSEFSINRRHPPPISQKTEKNKLLEWKPEYNVLIKKILKLVYEITQNKHFIQNLDTRVVCDASTSGLGAVMEQSSRDGLVVIAYASLLFLGKKLNC